MDSALPFRILLTWLAVVLSFPGCTPAGTDTSHPIVLRLGHNQSIGHPYDQAARRLAASVSEATRGEVVIKIYPSSQLGDTSEQLEGLLLGTLDFSIAAFAFASEFEPRFGLFGAPYLFDDVEHFGAVFDGRVGGMLDSLSRKRSGMGLIATLTSGERAFFNSTRPIESISDLRGLKVRVMSGKADALTWQAFGASPTPMPYSEVYSALQAGVIDGAENDPASILSNRFYESCPYLSLTSHMVLPMGIFAGKRTRQILSEETWEIIATAARTTAEWQRHFMEEQNAGAVDAMQNDFGVIVSFPDKGELSQRVFPIQDEMARELNATALLEEIRNTKPAG